jgi:hypothetical protein
MTNDIRQWVDSAWERVRAGDHAGAREMASVLIAQAESEERAAFLGTSVVTVGGQGVRRRGNEIADAEEILAAVELIEGNYAAAVGRAQQAILRSEEFRAGANMIAAWALLSSGESDLAASKLNLVAQRSTDVGIRAVALIEANKLADRQ